MKRILTKITIITMLVNTFQLISSGEHPNRRQLVHPIRHDPRELAHAIRHDDLGTVKELITTVYVKTKSYDGRSFLHMCTNPDILRAVLLAGADVNSRQSGGDPLDREGGSSRTEPWPLITPLEMMQTRLDYYTPRNIFNVYDTRIQGLKECIAIMKAQPDLIPLPPKPEAKPRKKPKSCCSIM